MRNLKLVDGVIALHNIARDVEEEYPGSQIAVDLRRIADRLHRVSMNEGRASKIADEIIKQVKE